LEFRDIFRVSEAIAKVKQMKIDPCCQRRNCCSPLYVLFSDVYFTIRYDTLISHGVPPQGASKKRGVVKNKPFSGFKRQYLKNGSRYG